LEQARADRRVREDVVRDWFPQLEWMKSLESLVLIKLGPHATEGERVISFLLDSLIGRYLFPRVEISPIPRPLRCIWIQDYEVYRCGTSQYLSPEILQSYRTGDCDETEKNYESFPNIENLGGSLGLNFAHQLPSLQKLKYASGSSYKEEEVFEIFWNYY